MTASHPDQTLHKRVTVLEAAVEEIRYTLSALSPAPQPTATSIASTASTPDIPPQTSRDTRLDHSSAE